MKKRFIFGLGLILLLSGTSNLLAYTFKITNLAKEAVTVELKTSLVVAKGHKKSIVLNPGKTGKIKFTGIQAGACLASYKINEHGSKGFYKAEAIGGLAPLVAVPIFAPAIGLAQAVYACRSQHLYVIPVQAKGKKGYTLIDAAEYKTAYKKV